MFSGFTFGVDSIFEEVARFSPFWFLRGKFFMSLVSCVYVVHVILSNKILRSYCLNDKNLTHISSISKFVEMSSCTHL